MKALVTGGTGFIGSHLVERLLKEGYDVRCLKRNGNCAENLAAVKSDVEFAIGTLEDVDSLERAVQGVDIIFHAAGAVAGKALYMYAVNVQGTSNLYEAAKRAEVERFIHLSSLTAAGPSALDGLASTPRSEEDPSMPINSYGKSKRAAERLLKNDRSIPTTIIRPPAVYGPRDKEVFKLFESVARYHFGPVYKGRGQKVSFVFVDDLVEGIVAAAKSDRAVNRTYNISEDRAYLWQELYAEIAKATGSKVYPIPVPAPFRWGLGLGYEIKDLFFGTRSIESREKFREAPCSWECSPEKAERHFGFKAKVPLAEGVQRTADWYLEKGLLKIR